MLWLVHPFRFTPAALAFVLKALLSLTSIWAMCALLVFPRIARLIMVTLPPTN